MKISLANYELEWLKSHVASGPATSYDDIYAIIGVGDEELYIRGVLYGFLQDALASVETSDGDEYELDITVRSRPKQYAY